MAAATRLQRIEGMFSMSVTFLAIFTLFREQPAL
jgi:hypothetical protein